MPVPSDWFCLAQLKSLTAEWVPVLHLQRPVSA